MGVSKLGLSSVIVAFVSRFSLDSGCMDKAAACSREPDLEI